jgi:hypothetical protein
MFQIVKAFLLGVSECRLTCTTYHDDLSLSAAYEKGRAWTHTLTLHHFDPC